MDALPIRFRTLGSLDLRSSEGSELRAVTSQPKRLALLAYLAAAEPGGLHRRDSLLGLFWPELDQEHARNALRQAVHFLRRELGAEVVVGRGDELLGVDETRLSCDAAEFRRRLASGDRLDALDLYRGDFLPGFFVSDAPEFERWLETERSRLRDRAAQAAWYLAEQASDQGRAAEAGLWARRAAGFAPDEEPSLRRLLRVLTRAGDRAGALHAYDDFANRLKREFGAEPSGDTQALVRALRASPPLRPEVEPGFPEGAAVRPVAAKEPQPDLSPPPRRRRARVLLALVGAVLLVATVGVVGTRLLPGSRERLDAHLVVVTPFEVAGADSGLGFLAEGMLDLLAAKLPGEGGLRAANPRAVLSAWTRAARRSPRSTAHDLAREAARQLGAGRVALGSIVGRPERMVVTATLLDVADGAIRSRASVEGPADSLPELVDGLAAELLVGESVEPPRRLAELASASLPALRGYLAGRSAYRRGRYLDAVEQFRRAAELDSSSAVIALELAQVADWITDETSGRAQARAWQLRSRLGAADRAFLEALLGPRYPQPSPLSERLASWERAARLAPDRPEAWYELGDELFHYGGAIGRDSGGRSSEAAFARAVLLDSSYTAPLMHLIQLAIWNGDAAAARQRAALYFAHDSAGDDADFVRWRVAVALGDSGGAQLVERRLETLPTRSLGLIATWGQLDGVRVDAALRAALIIRRRAVTPTQRRYSAYLLAATYGNLGRFAERDRLVDEIVAQARASDDARLHARIADVMLWDGDSAAAQQAVASLERKLHGGSLARPGASASTLLAWHLLEEPQPDRRLLDSLQGLAAAQTDQLADAWVSALRAIHQRQRDAADRVHVLDSLRLAADVEESPALGIEAATALQLLNEHAKSLAVVRQRQRGDLPSLYYLAGCLRLEGREAAALGDVTGAVRAYRHYLALRFDPDPAIRPGVETVRAELARLTAAAPAAGAAASRARSAR